jgi:alpha-maltose-1-phosphate synthase
MRAAYLNPACGIPLQGPSGASAHIRGICTALRSRCQLEVHSVLRSDHRGSWGEECQAGISGLPGWPSRLGRLRDIQEIRAARRLARQVLRQPRSSPLGLLIERHSLFSDAGWRLSEELGIPWLLEVNAPLCMERERFETLRMPWLAGRWERDVLQAAPAVAAVSRWLAGWLRSEMGCSNVHWIPNGVEAARGCRTRGRALLGVGDARPLVGFVGSMKPWHGLDRLERVAADAGATLVLAGHGAPPIQGAITGAWYSVQDLADVVAALDVGLALYPADAPPWFCPLKLLLYRSQGLPAVCTDIGDCRELLGDGGSIVSQSHDEIVGAVRHWLGRRCRRKLRSWLDVADEILRIPTMDDGSGYIPAGRR